MPDSDEGFSPRLVDSLVDALVVIEEGGKVIYANPALGRLLGWRVDQLFGKPLTDFLPERLREPYMATFKEWMALEPPPRSPGPSRIAMLRADGSELPVDVGTFLVAPENGPRLVIAALWDAMLRIDIERYQRVADDLMAFLAEASGPTNEVVPHLLGIIATSLDFDFATAWRWDADEELLRCEHLWFHSAALCRSLIEASTEMTVRPGEGLAGLVVTSNEPKWHSGLAESTGLRRHKAIVSDRMQSAFVFPIRTKDRLVGVVELFTATRREPDRALFDAVAEIGARMGDFIERLEFEVQRSDLLAQLEQSQRQQGFLLQANLALAEAGDFNDAVRRLAEVAVPTLGDICLIDVLDPNGDLVRLAAKHGDPERQSVTDRLGHHPPEVTGNHPAALAVRTGQSQWSTDMSEAFLSSTTQDEDHYEITRQLNFQSYASVPLVAGEETIGAMTIVATAPEHQFGRQELLLAEALAKQVARAIERARTFDEQSAIARHLQHSLLPDVVDEHKDLRIAVRYEASGHGAQVGGDFYDVIPLSGDRVALAIGDVEGHDMIAATVMGQLRSAMRAFLSLDEDPGLTLSLLDRFVLGLPTQRIATATLVILDTGTGEIACASAGHPPAIVGDGARAVSPLSVRPGPPLGVGKGRFPVMRLDLSTPAVLVLYTDGLVDEGRPGGAVRLGRLLDITIDNRSEPPDGLADIILLGLTDPGLSTDDTALLVVRWEPA